MGVSGQRFQSKACGDTAMSDSERPRTRLTERDRYLQDVKLRALDVPRVTGSICDVGKLVDLRGVDFLKTKRGLEIKSF